MRLSIYLSRVYETRTLFYIGIIPSYTGSEHLNMKRARAAVWTTSACADSAFSNIRH